MLLLWCGKLVVLPSETEVRLLVLANYPLACKSSIIIQSFILFFCCSVVGVSYFLLLLLLLFFIFVFCGVVVSNSLPILLAHSISVLLFVRPAGWL